MSDDATDDLAAITRDITAAIAASAERRGFRNGISAVFTVVGQEADPRTALRIGKRLLTLVEAEDPIAEAAKLEKPEPAP